MLPSFCTSAAVASFFPLFVPTQTETVHHTQVGHHPRPLHRPLLGLCLCLCRLQLELGQRVGHPQHRNSTVTDGGVPGVGGSVLKCVEDNTVLPVFSRENLVCLFETCSASFQEFLGGNPASFGGLYGQKFACECRDSLTKSDRCKEVGQGSQERASIDAATSRLATCSNQSKSNPFAHGPRPERNVAAAQLRLRAPTAIDGRTFDFVSNSPTVAVKSPGELGGRTVPLTALLAIRPAKHLGQSHLREHTRNLPYPSGRLRS